MAATIVNVSSLAAVTPAFPGMGIYSAGKAARDRYHTLLARQEDDDDDDEESTTTTTPVVIRPKYLNYAPGPLTTDMTQRLRTSTETLSDGFRSQFDPENLVDPRESARKLLDLLETDDFESGSHIDYYDLVSERSSG